MNDLVARLRKATPEWLPQALYAEAADTIEALQADVAARDLVIKQIREAIEALDARYTREYEFSCTPIELIKARATLHIQPSTEAIDAYVAKEMDEMINSLPLDPAIKTRITTMIRHKKEGK
jgi:hypothetical protein